MPCATTASLCWANVDVVARRTILARAAAASGGNAATAATPTIHACAAETVVADVGMRGL